MKKLLILLLGLFIFTSVNAQFGYGVKGGLTISHMNLDIPLDFSNSPNFGIHTGMFFIVPIKQTGISFQPEIQFIQKGVRIDDDLSDNYMNVRLNYLEFPILFRTSIYMEPINIYFTCGPYGSVLLNHKYETEGLNNYEIELRNGSLDAGIVLSVGMEFKGFLMELRGSTGLVNVAGQTDDFYDDSRNNYINFSIGYIIK